MPASSLCGHHKEAFSTETKGCYELLIYPFLLYFLTLFSRKHLKSILLRCSWLAIIQMCTGTKTILKCFYYVVMVYMLHRGKTFYITNNLKPILATRDNRKNHFWKSLNYTAWWKKSKNLSLKYRLYIQCCC